MKMKIECCEDCPCLHSDEHKFCLLSEKEIDFGFFYERVTCKNGARGTKIPDNCPWRKDGMLEVEILECKD